MFFILLQKLLSFSRKPTFRILDIQVSWRNQMPKHKARNTFYWITWEINTLIIKFGQFVSYYKKKFIKRFYKNCDLKTSSRSFCVRKELSTTSIRKWNFWSKLLILDMYEENYQNLPKSAHTSLRFLFTKDSLKLKKGLELVFRPHFS